MLVFDTGYTYHSTYNSGGCNIGGHQDRLALPEVCTDSSQLREECIGQMPGRVARSGDRGGGTDRMNRDL